MYLKNEGITNIIGENIRSYRMKSGFSLREVGEKLQLSHMSIQKYEQGSVVPDTSILIKLADIFQVSVDRLLLDQPKISLDSQSFRKRKVKSSLIERIESDMSRFITNYLQIESYFDNRDLVKVQSRNMSFKLGIDGNCEEIAANVRNLLGFGEGVIDNLIQSLEDKGFLVLLLQRYEKIDGVSGFYNDIPIIVLSDIESGDRMRFTTAHELGHLYIENQNELSEKEVENQMDCFASAFLMPISMMKAFFGDKRDKISLKEIRDFKERNKVSMQAIIHRLYDLSIITVSMKTNLLQQMYKNGMSINEPGLVAPETPNVIKRLVSQLVTEEIISVSKGAQLLDTNIKDFIENALLDN